MEFDPSTRAVNRRFRTPAPSERVASPDSLRASISRSCPEASRIAMRGVPSSSTNSSIRAWPSESKTAMDDCEIPTGTAARGSAAGAAIGAGESATGARPEVTTSEPDSWDASTAGGGAAVGISRPATTTTTSEYSRMRSIAATTIPSHQTGGQQQLGGGRPIRLANRLAASRLHRRFGRRCFGDSSVFVVGSVRHG